MKTTVLFALTVFTFAAPAVCLASNSIVPVPEPATGLLIVAGAAGAAAYRKFRKRSR